MGTARLEPGMDAVDAADQSACGVLDRTGVAFVDQEGTLVCLGGLEGRGPLPIHPIPMPDEASLHPFLNFLRKCCQEPDGTHD